MDELQMVTELADVPAPDASHVASVREALLAMARTDAHPRRSGRILAAAAVVAAVGGGSVYAGLRLSAASPSTNTTIECGPDTYIPTESGNPVADCYAALARSEATVPPLVGWITPGGLVAVLPQSDPPPAGSRPLPAGFQVSAPIRYVNDALGDQAGPLSTGCLSPAEATSYAEGVLATAGLGSWHVSVTPSGSSCDAYVAVVDAGSSSVGLRGFASTPGSANVENELDQTLQGQLRSTCTSAASAMALARGDAQHLSIPSDALSVSDGGVIGTTGCATAFVEPGGDVDVVVWTVPAT